MTLTEYDTKITHLKKIRNGASGMRLAELTSIIDDLATARVELITMPLINITGMEDSDIDELNAIATTFDDAAEEIANVNQLIDNGIRIGKKLVSLVV